ncbi:oxidoreductase [Gluconacetobacter johannae DSM 13595]|uniref:SDR family oxidoreductase n=1 Tax=Gluconacetobacter johannae TaxID=112140 RepID=A0A7W4J696_9PROT|nr:SDR family oxidoreductase [Gluconacetobacter johannae]MBB2175202.1 SDR family oxidoreductase [Gluconacetobacter johannae]GBQ80621.1 oxidoreductase [Gluconacetobacter johannae DSM 13595]
MDLGLNGRTALVLGASRGLGRAVARSLLAEGVAVYAGARNLDAVREWQDALPPEQRARVTPVSLDLSSDASVMSAAETVIAAGGVDILVNNSGGPPPGAVTSLGPDVWTAQFNMMAGRIFLLTNLLLPAMQKKKWGRVLTVASSGIIQPIPNLALSNSIRSAISGWSKTLSNEVAADGITVNMVIPGRIHTDRVDQLDGLAARRRGLTPDDIAAESWSTIPAHRYGRPEEFADVVTFLASARASYITGSSVRVDGGLIRSV